MKYLKTLLSAVFTTFLLFTSCNSEAQNTKQSTVSAKGEIEVIQFHSEHRCMTCNKIESQTIETLKNFKGIQFSLVNIDDKKNDKISKEFQAYGTALYLYNPQSGEKKDLTDFAFMNASNQEKFIEGLSKEIKAFKK